MFSTQLTPRVEMILRGIKKERSERRIAEDTITYHNPNNVQAKAATATEPSRL